MKRLKLCGEKWQKKGFYSNFIQILFLANSFWHLTSFGSNGKITSMPTKFCSDNTNSLIVKLNSTGNFARWHSILNIRTASKKVCPQRLKGKNKEKHTSCLLCFWALSLRAMSWTATSKVHLSSSFANSFNRALTSRWDSSTWSWQYSSDFKSPKRSRYISYFFLSCLLGRT